MTRIDRLLCAFGLLGAVSANALHSQQSLLGSTGAEEGQWRSTPSNVGFGGIEVDEDGWDFAAAPPPNSTAQLVFSTVQNLLQHWPNTRYRNGHNLVPGTVPIGTLLYHGTYHNALPTSPDWVATDPEHSYLFCASREPDAGCWHTTLVVSRPLRVLYFDGSSAAKMTGGPMDSQDVVIWDAVRPDKTFSEAERIRELCAWGKEVGLDGFVRMEMDFEIMLCDFTAKVDLVSLLNLRGTPQMRHPPPPPPRKARPHFSNIRVIEAGSWHNGVPGETRIHLDYPRLISFYDPVMFPSLVEAREGKPRLEHRLDGLSKDDAQVFRRRLDEAVRSGWEGEGKRERDGDGKVGSGFDWKSLFNTVTERFAERIELLAYILTNNNTTDSPKERVLKAHRHVASMTDFYALFSANPPRNTSTTSDSLHAWAQPVFAHCATTHTRWLEKTPAVTSKLTDSERLLLRSVKGVQKEICRVLVGIWADGAEMGMLEPEPEDARLTTTSASKISQRWLERTEGLMQWLDWNYWLRCRPECSYEEMCYLPTWPFFKSPGRRGPLPGGPGLMDRLQREFSHDLTDDEEYKDPQPRCIRRVEPFSLERETF